MNRMTYISQVYRNVNISLLLYKVSKHAEIDNLNICNNILNFSIGNEMHLVIFIKNTLLM